MVRRLACYTGTFLGIQVRLDGSDDACCDLVLDCKNIIKVSVVAFCPDVPATCGLDQLAGDTNAAS
jgi:hypothetical protein